MSKLWMFDNKISHDTGYRLATPDEVLAAADQVRGKEDEACECESTPPGYVRWYNELSRKLVHVNGRLDALEHPVTSKVEEACECDQCKPALVNGRFVQIGATAWIKADDICYIGRERKENGRLVVLLTAGGDADYYVEKEYEQGVLSLLEQPAPEDEACECESACKQQDADSLEQRVRDLECEVESLFAFQRRDHPATRPVAESKPEYERSTFSEAAKLRESGLFDEQPAPVASEPGSIPLFTVKPRGDYWCNDYEPATPAQVKAEAVRLCPEVRVALELLRITLCGESYADTAVWLRRVNERWVNVQHTMNDSVLAEMAAVLESAAKAEAE